jgi:ferredoxin
MIIKVSDFFQFLWKCQDEGLGHFQELVVPRKSRQDSAEIYFSPLSRENEHQLDRYRTVDPLRLLFYFNRETLTPAESTKPRRLIVGAKGCDLTALKLLDKALINDDFVDPVYALWRESTYIISADCQELSGSCHCNLVNGKPFAEDGFDLNLSRMNDYYLLTVGSEKGEELLKLIRAAVPVAEKTSEAQRAVDTNRRTMEKRLAEQNKAYERPAAYQQMRQAPPEIWIEASNSCVGCGACTNICPTCYCIIVNDETTGDTFTKVRSTDSCQLHGYARVAGGDTPRPKMYQRFRNRYLCKFDYMQHNFDLLGCTGCGRCIDACPGKIDFREVVQKILHTVSSAKQPAEALI